MPIYDLRCEGCGRTWERVSTIAERYAPCETCGAGVVQEFKHSVQATPFIPYFDWALGEQVTSLADRWRLMRPQTDGDEISRGKLEYRDKMSKGDLSARQDRLHQQAQERARG